MIIETQRTETHAYDISHIDKTNMPPCKFVAVDVSPTNDDLFSSRELEETGSESSAKHEYVSPNFVIALQGTETLSNTTECSTISGNEPQKPTLPLKYLNKPSDKCKNEPVDQSNILLKESVEDNDSNIKYSSSKLDHVYEEVNTLECDIMDYYEKYSPTTAKTLINTLFLPRQKICKQCASSQDSPVYSDRLIYGKKPLYAREVRQFQQNDTLCFKYYPENGKQDTIFSQYDNNQHCLIVCNYLKTNASSILYFYGQPRDIFNMKTALKPNILLISCDTNGVVNTELYHRCANNFYTRISNNGIAPMTFRMNHNDILSTIKHIGYDTDLQNWMNYRNDVFRSQGFKQDDLLDHRANRSSLLLLEPLLLMPELTSPRYRHGKNRISQSEHVKIVKIVVAYTLSFFILATITLYIVYFT